MTVIQAILLVEDDPPLRELYRLFLVSKGYKVELAVDGEEALAKARSLRPDLILLDIMIPKKDGFQVLRELSNDPSRPISDTRVIALTNLGREHLPDDVSAQLDAYIIKSEIELEDLVDAIKSLEH